MSKWLRKVNIGQEVIHCPNCGSGHVKKSPSAMLIFGIPLIILISILPSVWMRGVGSVRDGVSGDRIVR